MNIIIPRPPREIIDDVISSNDLFPNNSRYPLLIYRQTFTFRNEPAQDIQQFLHQNGWINSWVDGIYDYHHYHSNTHETLVIIQGNCQLQAGGEKGRIYYVSQGDVIIIPAGVSHKNMDSSYDFKCIGAYPVQIDYDMNYGKEEEHPQVDINIKKVGLPEYDPVFGKEGLIFSYWK